MANLDLDEVIKGANHCISGKPCQSKCPYWDKKRQKCGGDYRKDMLNWLKYLKTKVKIL